jgi:hypothetical protein
MGYGGNVMSNVIKMGEFDDVESANTWGILEILNKVKLTAPVGTKVEWQYPGYISIALSDGTEIAFGESLSHDTGYTWNDFTPDGTNRYADYIADLGDVNLIVSKLWEQTAHILENGVIKND